MAGDFGAGLGSIIGAGLGNSDIQSGMDAVTGLGGQGAAATSPFIGFGQGLLGSAGDAIGKVNNAAGNVPQFDDFMKNFQLSNGAQYQMGQSLEAADNSASAAGGLLSGANLRNRETIAQGITSTDAQAQYSATLAGNNQAFGQDTAAAATTLAGVGVGTGAAATAQSGINSQMTQQANLAAAQAKNDQGKGSGIGSMLGGIGGIAAKF